MTGTDERDRNEIALKVLLKRNGGRVDIPIAEFEAMRDILMDHEYDIRERVFTFVIYDPATGAVGENV